MSVTDKSYKDLPGFMIFPQDISPTAADGVRLTFNPSGLATVTRIKLLAAALLNEYEAIRDSKSDAAREASVAITNLQQASMWAVLAATKGMP